MKKFLVVAAIATTLGAGGYFGIQATQQAKAESTSNLLLANAEAISADNEGGGGSSDYWDCWSQSENQNGGGFWRCGNPCEWIKGEKGVGSTGRCH